MTRNVMKNIIRGRRGGRERERKREREREREMALFTLSQTL